MDTAAAKIALGTVQFGLDYGISNTQGQVDPAEIADILACCRRHGIGLLDTAAAYGESEMLLGQALQAHPGYFGVVSKTVPGSTAVLTSREFHQSRERLGLPKLQGYLVHDFQAFENDPGIYLEVLKLQEAGWVSQVGFSVYYPAQVERILQMGLPFQLLQLPFNVFDQRFSYLLPRLAQMGVEVHVRSVFLQGLFFRSPDTLPAFFDSLKPKLQALHQIRQEAQVPLTALLLGFAHTQPGIAKMVIGVTSVAELMQNLTYLDHLASISPFLQALQQLAVNQEHLILPFNWNK